MTVVPLAKLLILDDEAAQMKALCNILELEGYSTLGFTSPGSALQSVREHRFDLVLTDLTMPEMDGVAFLRAALEINSDLVGIVMTGNGTIDTAVQAMQAGALDYILKPFKLSTILPVLSRSLAVQRLRMENVALVAERNLSEARLRKSERHLRLMADAMPQIVCIARPDGSSESFNQRWYEFIGQVYSEPRGHGKEMGIEAILHPDDLERYRSLWKGASKFEGTFEVECRFLDRRIDCYRWHLGRAVPLRDELGEIVNWVGTYTDIDDHKRSSEDLEQRVNTRTVELQQSLRERSALLMEVHHRVRNNLEVICSLLSQQAERSERTIAEPLQAAHCRVMSMSLIHDQLYQSNTFSNLDLAEYIHRFTGQFLGLHRLGSSPINLDIKVKRVLVSLDVAIPCGLLLNELLTNAVRHAFSDGRPGNVRVFLEQPEPGWVELTVADNGTGLPAGLRVEDAQSLGFTVIRILVAQLGAHLKLTCEGGTAFAICWQLRERVE